MLKLPISVTGVTTQARWRGEYEILQPLQIPGIVRPVALTEEQGWPVMVLEDFAGESLEVVLAQQRLDLAVCLCLGSQLAQILSGLHAAGIVHRDIRPANLLVDAERQQLRLLDLSRATVEGHDASAPGRDPPGDWAYLSPEQTGRLNRPVDHRTDGYSLGITLYRMLTGQLPFTADDPLEWAHCHIARIPTPPCEIAPEVPQPVSALVSKLLAKLPEDRYQSMRGVQLDLDQCLAQWQSSGRVEPFVLGADDVSDRFEIPHRLYGREPEIAGLLGAFERMAATGQAELVTVSGYSGIGKSSLVHALHQPIVRRSGHFISGKFDQYQRDIPYATLAQAFTELMQQLLAESDERIAQWRKEIQAAVGSNGQLIIDVLPQVELIIGKQPPVPVLPRAEGQNRFHQLFQQFMAVLSRKERPLILFLDDLQWIDAASLKLIEHLLSQPDTRYLLLIAAYRDNEASPAYPLMTSLDAIRNSGAPVTGIQLAPLGMEQLNQLVADTLHAKPSCSEPLTRLVFQRTQGNPFFFIQFLDSLYEEGLLQHDANARVWKWDLDKIKAKDFAANVVDLMLEKLRRFSLETQKALQFAACLGNRFDLTHIALVSGVPGAEVERRLSVAVSEGVITYAGGTGKFLHDRIQQAAYSLIAEEERAGIHLQIGRSLYEHTAPEEAEEKSFEIVNQWNRGAALITSSRERERLVQLNLVAGQRAKRSTAYTSALKYFVGADALLVEDRWDRQYPLTFALELQRAECEYLTGAMEAAELRLSTLWRHAGSLVDRAAVACLRIDLYTTVDRSDRAIEACLEYLRCIEVRWSPHPTPEEVRLEYEQIWRQLGDRSIEALVDLPPMTDPDGRATIEVLASAQAAAHFTDGNLPGLMSCRMVNLSLQQGNSDASCLAYAWLGMILGPRFGDYRTAYRFGKLGCELAERQGEDRFKVRAYLGFGAFVNPWVKAIPAGRAWLRRAFDTANKIGDFNFAAHSCNSLVTNLLASGDPLGEVQGEAENGLDSARKARFGSVIGIITTQLGLIRQLRGLTPEFSSFNDAGFDEGRFEQHLEADPRSTIDGCLYWIRKLQLRFFAGDYPSAIEAASRAERLLWTAPFVLEMAEYHFFGALARSQQHDAAPAAERRGHWEALAAHHQQLQRWSDSCPENFENRAALVAAEIARLEDRDFDALRLYERAIQSAHENGFVQNEGLAHELAARFCLARGLATAGGAHLEEARACFGRWGADGKVRQLEARYPLLRARPAPPPGGEAQLDLLSVAKAAQAISDPIVLDELIETLLRIVVENAGAQNGYLLLVRGDEMDLAAEASVEHQTVRVRRAGAEAISETILPASILQYVRRSREPVLLADAAQPHPFSADDAFARRQPKSVLCLPILRQSALIGLLYLEHHIVTHAFAPERLTVLGLLVSQAAISLENARLYGDLREREARIRRLVDSNVIGIFFWDVQGAVTEANEAFLGMSGYSREDLRSGKIRWTSLTQAKYCPLDARTIEELKRTGSFVPFEKEYIRKDGRRMPVLIGGALFEGSPNAGVAFVVDLTERKQAEADREARRAAETANQAKSQFLANMGHELRTPLNGILGYAQILQRDRTLSERQASGLNVIENSGEHLLTLINDILDISKIEAGKLDLAVSEFPLTTFLRTLYEIIRLRAEEKGLNFVFDTAADLPAGIRTDEKRLRQVLLNLLANAVKFTDRGEVRLRVRFTPSARLRFEVQDTGIGIPQNQWESIFQPFEQVGEMQRRLGGTGLGLAISRQIVRRMGGDLHVQSRVGEGSSFWFELDLPAVAVASAGVRSERLVIGYAGPRRRILVADDVAQSRAVLVDLLRSIGFEMTEAVNGREGLEQAQGLPPDLILMDLVMPEMGGLEAIRQLRQLPAFAEVPIIAISASASHSDAQRSLGGGANAFLPKPIALGALLAKIATLLKLEWTYESTLESDVEVDATGPMVVPPAHEMEILHCLAQEGNMRAIAQEADRVVELDERYRPLANELRRLAKAYQSQAILGLVERCKQGRPAP